jgi:hypothetical protein
MSERDVAEIKESLATITRLLAAQVGADLRVAERAPLLHRLGVDRNAIAIVCGTNPAVISVRLAEAKRGGRGARRRANGSKVTTEAGA